MAYYTWPLQLGTTYWPYIVPAVQPYIGVSNMFWDANMWQPGVQRPVAPL